MGLFLQQLSLSLFIGITYVHSQVCDTVGTQDNQVLTCGSTVSQAQFASLNAVGGSACTDTERNKLLCGFETFTTDANDLMAINSPGSACVDEQSMKCACLNTVGAQLTLQVNSLCLASVTTNDYNLALNVTGSAVSYQCNGNQIINVCGSTFVAINGGLSNWGNWGTCGPCGAAQGTQSRTRTCSNPSPANNGTDCSGLGGLSESQNCAAAACSSTPGGGSGSVSNSTAQTTVAAGGGNSGASVVTLSWISLFMMLAALYCRMK